MQEQMDFTQGSILKKLVRFMLPILAAQVLQAMYGAVDLLIVGHFGTTTGISAVSTGSSVINVVLFTVAGLSSGVMVLMGRYIGERRPEKLSQVVGGAVCFFALLSVLIGAALLVFARPLSRLMQAPAEALDLTVTYVRICGGGILFTVFYNLISGIFRGMGDSKLPLLFVAIACGVNILGDLLLVAVFHLNVVGAAVATVAAQAVSVALSLLIIRRRALPFTLTVRHLRFNRETANFLRLGMPIALQELLTNLSFLALCAFINRLGLEASSGYGIACKLTNFVMLIPGSLMQSMSSFVAQNVGARNPKRAKRAMLTGMGIGASIGVVVFLLCWFQGELLSSIFANDEAVLIRSAEYLRGFAPEAVVTSILFSFIGYFSGNGRTVFVMFQGLAQTFLVRLPMSYLMSIQPNASLTAIGLAAPSATTFGIILNILYFIWFSRKQKRVRNGQLTMDN